MVLEKYKLSLCEKMFLLVNGIKIKPNNGYIILLL